MRSIRVLFLIVSIVTLVACSSAGRGGKGAADGFDGMGEGNIPIAEPGLELRDVNFAFDSSALSQRARGILSENGRWMLDNPNRRVVVEGHCDERGTAEYNLALGLRRAQSVADYLRGLGVRPDQMEVVSYGKELPLDPRSNEEAWARNRRAHFAVRR